MLHDAKLLLPNHCIMPKDLLALGFCEVHHQYRCIWQPNTGHFSFTSLILSCYSTYVGFILHTDLDQFKRNDNNSFGHTCTDTSSDGKGLCDLFHTKKLLVQSCVLFIGGKFGGTFGCFHKNGSSNTAVQSRGTFLRDNVIF